MASPSASNAGNKMLLPDGHLTMHFKVKKVSGPPPFTNHSQDIFQETGLISPACLRYNLLNTPLSEDMQLQGMFKACN